MEIGNRYSHKLYVASRALVFLYLLVSCQVDLPVATPTRPGAVDTLPVTPLSTEKPTTSPVVAPTPFAQPTVALLLENSEVEYIIPLHIQHKTQDQLIVMFELDAALSGRVYWWLTDSSHQNASSIPFEADDASHLTFIQGLTPGQTYQIAVGLEGDDGVERMPSFLGKPWGPIEAATLSEAILPLTIGVFGDSGFGEPITGTLADRLSEQNLDMVIHTGDLVYLAYQEGSPEAAYQKKWYQTLSPILRNTVIYPVVGNHELDGDSIYEGEPYYFYAFPIFEGLEGGWQAAPEGTERQWYALEFGSLQILFLNTQQLYGGAGRNSQDAWLDSRLQDSRFNATIVVFHVPPFTSGRHSLDGRAVISSWVPAFEQSNVFLVLSGHDHNYERLEHNGITYIVSGGGSSVLYPLEQWRDGSLRFEARTHFVLLEVGVESIQIQAIDKEGVMFDSDIIKLTP